MNVFFKHISPGGRLLALVFTLAVFFILGIGVNTALSFFGAVDMKLLSQALSQVVVFGGTAIFFCYMFQDKPLKYMRFNIWRTPRTFLGVLIVLLLALPTADWLTTVNDGMHLPPSMAGLENMMRQISERSQLLLEGFLLRDGVGALIANILVLALVPALCEEMFFRGALQQTIVDCLNGKHHVAIWITAAVFSLMHGDFFAFLPRFYLGLLLGYLYYYSRSIWVNVTAHFLNNTFVVILYFLAAKGVIEIETAKSLGIPFVIVLVTFVSALLFFKYCYVGKREKNVEL